MSNVAQDTVQSLIDKLQSIANGALSGKTFHILSEEELFSKAKLGTFPLAGVVYEGMRSRSVGGPTHRTGLAATLNVAVIVFYKGAAGLGAVVKDNYKFEALELLDTIREAIRDTKGPSGHTWEFIAEVPAIEKGGVVVWVQRWQIPVMLTA